MAIHLDSQRKAFFVMAAAGLLAAVFAGPVAAKTPDVLNAVPADAAMFALVPHCDKLNKSIAALTKALGVEEPEATDVLGTLLKQLGAEKGFDRQGSLAVVLPAFNPMGEPQLIVLAPVSDYNAFVANFEQLSGEPAPPGAKALNLEGQTVYVKLQGKHAVLSNNTTLLQNFAPGNNAAGWMKLAGPLGAEAINGGDVTVMINWPKVGPILQGLVAMGLTQAQQMMEMQNNQALDQVMPGTAQLQKGMFKLFSDFILGFIRDTQAMMLVGRVDDKGVGLSIVSQFKAGTPMAKAFALAPSGPLSFDRLPGQPYLMAMAMDLRALPWQSLMDALDSDLIQKMPADSPMVDLLKAYSKSVDMTKKAKQAQFAWYASSSKDLTGLINMGYAYTTDQPDALKQAIKEYVQEINQAMGKMVKSANGKNPFAMSYQENAATVAGQQVDTLKTQIAVPTEAMQQTGADPGAMAVMAMLGKGINGYVATTSDALVMTQTAGTDTTLMSKMLAASNGSGTFDAKAGLTAIRGQLPTHRIIEGYLHMGKFIEMILGVAKNVTGGNMPAIPAPADMPPMAMSVSSQGGGLNFHVYIPTKTMAGVSTVAQAAIMQGMQQSAQQAIINAPQPEPITIESPKQASAGLKGKVVQLTDKNFDAKIAKGLTLVHFRADWSDKCRTQDRIIETLSGRYLGKVNFASLNIDVYDQIARKYTPKTVPTLVLFKDGKQANWFIGLTSDKALAAAIDKQLK